MPLRFFDILGADALREILRRRGVDGNTGGESGTVDALDLVELRLLLAGQARNLNGYPPTAILAFDGLHREGRDWSLSREFAHHLANLSN